MAAEPFRFYTSVKLVEITGRTARTSRELLAALREIDDATLFHHTHHFLLQHQFLTPEPPSGFAHWTAEVLQERVLAERLAGVDTVEFGSLAELRGALVAILEEHAADRPAPPGLEFHFLRAHSFVAPLGREAATVEELATALESVPIASIYHHVFEAKLRIGRGRNDLSAWLEAVGRPVLANSIARLDPYAYTAEELRQRLVRALRGTR